MQVLKLTGGTGRDDIKKAARGQMRLVKSHSNRSRSQLLYAIRLNATVGDRLLLLNTMDRSASGRAICSLDFQAQSNSVDDFSYGFFLENCVPGR